MFNHHNCPHPQHHHDHHHQAHHKVSLNLGEGLDLLNLGLDVGNIGLLGRENSANNGLGRENFEKLGRGEVMSGRMTGRRKLDFEGKSGGRVGRRKPQGRR